MITNKPVLFNSIIVLTLLGLFWLQSCEKKSRYLSQNKFSEILSELMIIEKLGVDDVQKIALTKKVFQDAGVRQEEFTTTKEHYLEDPEFWIKIYEQAEQLIKEKEKRQLSKQLKN